MMLAPVGRQKILIIAASIIVSDITSNELEFHKKSLDFMDLGPLTLPSDQI